MLNKRIKEELKNIKNNLKTINLFPEKKENNSQSCRVIIKADC